MPATDPRQELAQALRQLRVQAGSPGIRGIAERSRTDVSRQTIADALRGTHTPRWHYVEAIVTALGGDPEQIRPLWETARQPRPRGISHPRIRQQTPEPPPAEGVFEYQQLRVSVDDVAATYTAQQDDGWSPLHVFSASGGNTVWLVMQRFVEN